MPSEPLRDKSIVVTGVTGQVAEPVAVALARENRVVGAARFKDEAARQRLEEAGVELRGHRPAVGRRGRRCPPTPTTSSISPSPRPTTGTVISRPTAVAWPG